MAKIIRKNQKIFAASNPTEIGKFGSLAAGTAITTTDPEVIQELSAYDNGWNPALVADKAPCVEDFNGLEYLNTYQLAYILQAGIPEWNDSTTYYINSYCQEDGVIYKSITDDNLNNQPSTDGGTNWIGEISLKSLSITDTTDSSSSTTGALKVAGGLGVAKNIYAGTGFYGDLTGTAFGTMKRIYSNTLSSAATTINITGLDGNTDIEYVLKIFTETGANGSLTLTFNSDSGNNYNERGTIDEASATYWPYNLTSQPKIFTGTNLGNSLRSMFNINIFAKTGNKRLVSSLILVGDTTAITKSIAVWNNTSSNLTSIQINSTTNLLAGTIVELYARR